MAARRDIAQTRGTKVPARYVFAGVRVLTVVISALQYGCTSLAITSMVRSPAPPSTTSNTTNYTRPSADVCAARPEHSDASAAEEKDGQFDWSELTQSYVINGGTYGAVCSMMVGVYVVRGRSPKLLIACSMALTSLATLLTPALAGWSVYALVAARVLLGFVTGLIMPAQGQIETSWFPPDERQQMYGIIHAANHIDHIISASLTGVLIENYGWEFPFYLYGGISTASLVLWLVFVYDTPQTHPHITEEEKEYITSRVNKITDTKLPVPWVKIATSSAVWAWLSMSVSAAWLSFVFMTELPTYLRRMLHYSTSETGYVTSLAHASTALSQIFCGFFSQWLRRRGFVSHLTSYRIFNAIASLGPAATLTAITQFGCDATAIVALLVATTALSATLVAGSLLNYMDLAINHVPALLGVHGSIASAVGVASPTLAAALINHNQTLSAWHKVFYITAAVSAVPYCVFLVFGSVDEQPWNTPPPRACDKDPAPLGDVHVEETTKTAK
ncbi:sialin-like isoform X1 [Bacillus rossius redtenbacheri]|uniref:sialin-like isoform X1 n=1 Tax=Bacillus rossius redtenbacheri TaxID=93214 RepID=UPI002FDEE2F8